MPAVLPIILTTSHLMLAAPLPRLNIEPSCRVAAAASGTEGRDENACLSDERQARAKLQQQWHQFTGAERTHCLQLSRLGGYPSYVELLTCLQIAKDAKDVPSDGPRNGSVAQ
jgi:hypothetical protein